jgi:hypothetical protein
VERPVWDKQYSLSGHIRKFKEKRFVASTFIQKVTAVYILLNTQSLIQFNNLDLETEENLEIQIFKGLVMFR